MARHKIGETGRHIQRQVGCVCPDCKSRNDDRESRMSLIRRVAAEKGVGVAAEPKRKETQRQFARRMSIVARGRRRARAAWFGEETDKS